jgi:dolichol kinase
MYDHYESLLFYFIPILTLAACDPIAALVGRKFPWKPYRVFGHAKTMSGSLAFFGSSVLITTFILKSLLPEISLVNLLLVSISLGFFTAIIEAISHKGFDNFTIPVVALLVLIACDNFGILL